ncbi:DUF4190 domain-containing protein [Rathayibacter sp. ZW T2_19]|uniref:DUF4190 domain-containing protein n=1 Tax=Rathayibacter rubneri TaxID=2950106 RepID=A0A9X2DUW3_9MICO|nr:DUF4190 domain-containing protein [Rathayibacter rubneri]MCM6760928.1 DUF4190 domain-containing protein [Rathayibacter rubneri]
MSDESPRTPAPGWYPHPADLGSELYWDGSAWTDRSRPAAPQPPAAPIYGTPDAASGGPAPSADPGYGTAPSGTGGAAGDPYSSDPTATNPYATNAYSSNPYATNPYASPAASGRNPMAIASLVLGVLSLLVNPLFVPSILAIVFSVRGRAAAAVTGIGRGMATAGLVTGIAGIVFGGIGFLVNLGGFLSQLGS